MCGGFSCSKNTLVGINVVYVMVAFLLIGVGTYAKTSSIVVTLPIVGGIVACGVFLLFVAILGLIATVKHHQVMLFFYMMILFVIFVIQFSVACACIGVNLEQEKAMSKKAWEFAKSHKEMNLIHETEKFFQCCGYDENDDDILKSQEEMSFCRKNVGRCAKITTLPAATATTPSLINNKTASETTPSGRRKRDVSLDCPKCSELIELKMDKGFNAVGGLGLFFSLTELAILVVTYRFRKQIQESISIA